MAARRAGVTRVKAEIKGAKTDIVLALAERVKAEHIIPMLAKNPKWKVSGQTLRIDQADLGAGWFVKLKEDVESIKVKKSHPKKEEPIVEVDEAQE